jgi:hypothetical protein
LEPKNTRALTIASALFLPFVIQTLFVIWSKSPQATPPSVPVEYAQLVFSAGVGALFLARAVRRFGLLISLLYFLVMPFVMFFFTLFLVGAVYGDYI